MQELKLDLPTTKYKKNIDGVEYCLLKLDSHNHEYFEILHDWNLKEKNSDKYTCRPLKAKLNKSDYSDMIINHMNNGVRFYVLEMKDNNGITICGRITFFDYNSRNYSAEFGYYLPEQNRNRGFGKIMVSMFLECMFDDAELKLHKLYATTASGNIGSIKLLDGFGFQLDGKLRDHYWIREEIQDQLHYSLLKKEWENRVI